MRKRLQNLERLCQKMQALYGNDDPLVKQLVSELQQKKMHEAINTPKIQILEQRRFRLPARIEICEAR